MFLEDAIMEYKSYMEQQEKSEKTVSGYTLDLKFFKKWLEKEWNGPVCLEDLEFEDVEHFLKFLKVKRDYKPASRKRVSVAVKMFFKYAWKKRICKDDIASQIEDIKCVQKEREYLTQEEALSFIKEIRHPVVRIFASTLFYTGMRISEALALTPEDVDLRSNWILIRNGKGNKARKIPICKKLKELLEDYVQWRVESNQFFATPKTGGISIGRVQAIIKETRKRLGITKQITAHVFRHSFASELVKKDVNIVSISKLLGHSNLKTTSIYTHSSSEQLEEAINVL